MNILVTGSLGYDYIMDFSGRFADRIRPEAIHKISLSPLVDTLSKQYGGTAGNIAYNVHLLGIKPLILSCGGSDFGEYKKYLKKCGINTKYITMRKDVVTGTYFVVTDTDDNQIGAFYMGALKYNDTLSLSAVKERYEFVVIAPNTPSAMIAYVSFCREKKMRYLYDPAFQISNFTEDQLRIGIEGAQILIGNDYEIGLIEQKLAISHEELRTMVPIVVTTLAGKGSIVETRKESIHCKPARVKKVVDPTGAGDAYRAGFLTGFLQKFDLQVCGQMGSVAAAYTVEKYGTVTHTYTKKDFIRRYEENFGDKISW